MDTSKVFNEFRVSAKFSKYQKYDLFTFNDFYQFLQSIEEYNGISMDEFEKSQESALALSSSTYDFGRKLSGVFLDSIQMNEDLIEQGKLYFKKILDYYNLLDHPKHASKLNEILNEDNDSMRNELILYFHNHFENDVYRSIENNLELIAPIDEHLSSKQEYYSDEVPSLYTELGKIDPLDKKSIMKFINRYGLPIKNSRYTDYSFKRLSGNNFSYYHEIMLKISLYKQYFDYFINYYENNLDDNETAIEILSTLLNERYTGYFTLGYRDADFVPEIRVETLLDLAYFQIARALVLKPEIKRCKFCNHPFEVTHKKQEFCHPHPGLSRSSCKTAYNRRQKEV